MPNDIRAAIETCQREIIALAEKKIGRSLTESEENGIRRIHSIMMLESFSQALASPSCTPAEVIADLTYFANTPK